MSKRLRLALVASIVAGTLVGAFYHAWQRRPSVVHEFEWGRSLRGDGVLNVVSGIDAFDAERRRFSYYTGARASDLGPRAPAPTRVLAEAVHGSVAVRLLGFDEHERPRAADEALEIARIVSAATTSVFPATAIPVEIDLHFMPEGARFSLAKRVEWREGRPYALAIFTREQRFSATTPAHELYHVLALRWSLRKSPDALRRPVAATSYEQAAADLFAACGDLLADESLARGEDSLRRVAIPDREFEGVLAGDELAAAIELLASDSPGAGLFGDLLSITVFEHLFGEATVIPLDSPQAETLLALCKETAANPFALDAWLANLVPPVDGTPEAID